MLAVTVTVMKYANAFTSDLFHRHQHYAIQKQQKVMAGRQKKNIIRYDMRFDRCIQGMFN